MVQIKYQFHMPIVFLVFLFDWYWLNKKAIDSILSINIKVEWQKWLNKIIYLYLYCKTNKQKQF